MSEKIAKHVPAEIINADVGQFYTPLTIGTAKPPWKTNLTPHHLFDIINEPGDLNVLQFRAVVLDKIKDITQRGRLPIIVGGSLFYIKSLFFPPLSLQMSKQKKVSHQKINTLSSLWQQLNEIDPERASQLHSHDHYRIQRALDIWYTTGKKPSNYLPQFEPTFNTCIIGLTPTRDMLKDAISQRTISMIMNEGWIEEVRSITNSSWESFLQKKGLIGYAEIFAWLKTGENHQQLPDLIKRIQEQTWQYAKRQLTFLKKFIILLEKNYEESLFKGFFLSLSHPDENMIFDIIKRFQTNKIHSKLEKKTI